MLCLLSARGREKEDGERGGLSGEAVSGVRRAEPRRVVVARAGEIVSRVFHVARGRMRVGRRGFGAGVG